jgi:uncharacterized protein YndB with AHSA1/START domain
MDAVTASTAPAGSSATSDREMVTTREFDAPRELVFAAWTDRSHLSQWWGPNGFTTTTYEMEVHPGGVWRFTMHGPDGTDYPNHILYRVVDPPSRLEYDHGSGDPSQPPAFQVIVTFADLGGRTAVTLHSIFPNAAALEYVVREHGAVEGARQTLERFGEYLRGVAQ